MNRKMMVIVIASLAARGRVEESGGMSGTRYGADEITMSVQRNDEDSVYVSDFDRVSAAKERFEKVIYPSS